MDLGGRYFRSTWEANVARWLNALQLRGDILEWQYEPLDFEFKGIKRGVRFYKPDFFIKEPDREYYIEVKAFMDSKSITALARMARQYPQVTVLIMDKKKYAEIESEFGHLPGWEC